MQVDAWDFENRLDDIERELANRSARGRLAENLTRLVDDYPGDLLAGHYDDWIEAERASIRERYINAVWNAGSPVSKGRSDYVNALRYARLLGGPRAIGRGESPGSDATARACSDSRGRQLASIETCARTLENDLSVSNRHGRPPSFSNASRAKRRGVAAPLDSMSELDAPDDRSHNRERAVLLSRVDELVNGDGGVILVEGDAGIGKSRLVDELVDAAEWRDVRVLSAVVHRGQPAHSVRSRAVDSWNRP